MHKSFFPAIYSLIVLASPIVADAKDQATPGRPAMNPGEWVHTDDYPTAALVDRVEGITVFELTYNAAGVATGCKVTQGSGSAVLDETTCAVLNKRARFQPGRDNQGRSVGGTYRSRVRWILPRVPLPTVDQTVKIETDISASGELEGCRIVEGAKVLQEEGKDPCASPRPDKPFPVFLGADGKPTAYSVVMTRSFHFKTR